MPHRVGEVGGRGKMHRIEPVGREQGQPYEWVSREGLAGTLLPRIALAGADNTGIAAGTGRYEEGSQAKPAQQTARHSGLGRQRPEDGEALALAEGVWEGKRIDVGKAAEDRGRSVEGNWEGKLPCRLSLKVMAAEPVSLQLAATLARVLGPTLFLDRKIIYC